jgi:hypothetical protein
MMIGAGDLVVVVDEATTRSIRRSEPHCRHPVVLRIAGRTCAVHFDEASIARRFALRYADLAAPGAVASDHAFAARDFRLGPIFWSRHGPVYRWPYGALAEEVVVFLADAVAMTAFFNERRDGVFSIHAAAVGIGDAAAAIVGETNAGKTTTTVACGRIGLALYSDERCLLDADGLVHPFPRTINVRAAGSALLMRDDVAGGDPVGELLCARGAADWNDVRFNELFASWAHPQPAPLRAVFLLDGAGAQARVRPATSAAAINAVARWTFGAGRGLERFARLHAAFRGAACFHLELGSPDASARAVRDALLAAVDGLGCSA